MKNSKKSVKMLLVKTVGSLLIALPLTTSAGGSDYSASKQPTDRGTAPVPTASAPVVAAAGNGGAYNGPTFTTGAIPVSAERGIKEKNLKISIETCVGTNDKNTGSKTFTGQIAAALGVTSFEFSKKSYKPSLAYLANRNDKYSIVMGASLLNKKIGEIKAIDYESSKYFAPPNIKLFLNGNISEYTGDINLISLNEMPFLTFTSRNQDSAYDQYGRLIPGETTFTGLSIIYKDRILDYRNSDTSKVVFSVPMDDFVMCLQNEIQRYLE
jgi:hypothetical protein